MADVKFKFIVIIMVFTSMCTANVRGLRNKATRKRVFEYFKQSKHSIIALQETHQTNSEFKRWRREWDGPSVWNPHGSRSSGTAILFKKHLSARVLDHDTDYEGRVLRVTVEIESLKFQIVNVYGYNPEDEEESENFFQRLKDYIEDDLPCVLLGDFNMVLDLQTDRSGGNPRKLHTYGSNGLTDFLSENDLADSWKHKYLDRKGFSWRNNLLGIKSRLDRVYLPVTWLGCLKSVRVSPFSWSDHDEVSVNLELPSPVKRGPGFWKFNTSLLEDQEFNEHICRFVEGWEREKADYPDPSVWWDMGKYHWKRIAIEHSTRLARRKKSDRELLVILLDEAENQANVDENRVREIRQQIKEFDYQSAQRVFYSTHIKYLEENEKPTKYFFALQKEQGERKSIVHLYRTDKSGKATATTTSDQTEIRTEIANFYQKLFTKEENLDKNVQESLLANLKKKLPLQKRNKLETKLTKKEIYTALFDTENGRVPGWCGLQYEFYKHFWHILADSFYFMQDRVLNDIKRLSITQRKSIISLLFKDGDEKDIRNWRPVSLLCTDYKIIAKAIANRLKSVLGLVVHEDQTCAIPNRSIFSNLYLTRDVIRYTNQKRIKSYLISVDQEKAFDRVDRQFLYDVLERMNFGPNFIGWVKTLYTDSEACVLVNGYMSCFFPTTRGLKQGDPSSMEFYDQHSDVLSEWIRSDSRIEGVRLPGYKVMVVLSQYADDYTYYIANLKALYALFEALDFFERGTGSRIKPSKTKGLCLGGAPPLLERNIPIKWCDESGLRILGVTFWTDLLMTTNQNWSEVIGRLRVFTDKNRCRKLSLRGRVMNLNMAGLSKLWYLGTVFPVPDWLKCRIEQIIFFYVWGKRYDGNDKSPVNEPLARKTVYLSLDQGGLGLINPCIQSTALRTSYMRFVIDAQEKVKWVNLARYWVGFPLAKLHPEWRFLSINKFGNICDRVNYPEYYADCLKYLGKTDTSQMVWKTQPIRQDIQDSLYQEPRCQGLWENMGRTDIDWKSAWSGIYSSHASPFQKELHYLFLHQCLYTNKNLNRFKGKKGHKVHPFCDFCHSKGRNVSEDIFHLFFNCERANLLWQQVMPVLKVLSPNRRLRRINILLADFEGGVSDATKRLLLSLVQIIMQKIWLNRNLFAKRKILADLHYSKRDICAGIVNMVTAKRNLALRDNKPERFKKQFLFQPLFCRQSQLGLEFPKIREVLG